MSRLSMMACSSFSSARNVRSICAPERVLRRVVRTKAPPLPGFTCWKSTTWNSPSGRLRDIPRFRSLVETAGMADPLSVLGGLCEQAAPIGGDHDGVFDAYAAHAGEVHARFDGDDVAGGERSIGGPGNRGVLV